MKLTVNWCNHNEQVGSADMLTIEPIPVFKLYPEIANADFRKCPAHQNQFKNTYAVCSPIDFEIAINKEENWCNIIYPKSLPTQILNPRFKEEGDSPYPIFSLRLSRLLFTPQESEKDIYIEQINPVLEWDRANDIRVIEGNFNISKWTRPLECAFEQRTKNLTVKFKRGQPMYYARFSTDDPEDVIVLNRIEYTPELHKDVERCAEVKNFCPVQKLKALYELRTNFLNSFKKG